MGNNFVKRGFSTTAHQDYYKTLGIDKSANQKDIKKKYYELVKRYHPDIDKKYEAKFTQIVEAYNTLSDPSKRNEYDDMSSRFGFMNNKNPGAGSRASQDPYGTNTSQQGFYNHQEYSFYTNNKRKAAGKKTYVKFQDQFGVWHTIEVDGDFRSSGASSSYNHQQSQSTNRMYDDIFNDWKTTQKTTSDQYKREQQNRHVYDQVFKDWQESASNQQNDQYQHQQHKYDSMMREEIEHQQRAMLKRRFWVIIMWVFAFYYFLFIFKNAYKPPPGYVMYQDKETGEMMLVHHSKIAELEANADFKRPMNKYDEREHKRMQSDQLINQRIYSKTPNDPQYKETSNYPKYNHASQNSQNRTNSPPTPNSNFNMNRQNGIKNNDYMEIDLSELNKKSFFK